MASPEMEHYLDFFRYRKAHGGAPDPQKAREKMDYRTSRALKELGIYDDCAIFFLCDHGDFTGDYGLVEKTQNSFEECLTRVPLLVKPPKDVPLVPGIREGLVEMWARCRSLVPPERETEVRGMIGKGISLPELMQFCRGLGRS